MTEDSQGRTTTAIAFFGILFLCSGAAFVYLFWPYLTDFILAFMLTGIFSPVYDKLLVKLNHKPLWASVLTTTLVGFTVAIPVGFLITSLTAEAASFYNNTISTLTMERIELFLFGDGFAAQRAKAAAGLLGIEWNPVMIKERIAALAGALAGFMANQANQVVGNIFALMFHFTVMLLIIFYMLIDGDRLKQFFYSTSPLPEDEEALLIRKFAAVGKATLFGNGIGSAIQGLIGGISMAVVGLPSPILWGVVMTIFAFLPLVGVSVITIPATIYLLISKKFIAAILFFAFNTLQALFVENVVKTRLIGSHMSMHNLMIFLSIIAGIGAFGIIGILYGPLVVALFLTFLELYNERYKTRIMGTLTVAEGAEQEPLRAPE